MDNITLETIQAEQTEQAEHATKPEKTKRATPRAYYVQQGRVFVRLSGQYTAECLPIARKMMLVGQGMPDPEPPTYEIKIDPYDESKTREVFYTSESIKDSRVTDEEKEAWAAYQQAILDRQNQIIQLQATFLAREGIKLIPEPTEKELNAWAKESLEQWFIPVPDNFKDLRLAFIGSEVVQTQQDVMSIMQGVFAASGFDQEVIDQIEASFRD